MEEQRHDTCERSQPTRACACSKHGLAQSGRELRSSLEAARPDSAARRTECLNIILSDGEGGQPVVDDRV